MRLIAKERILLHLLECAAPGDEVEVSNTLSQQGVARGAGIERRHVAQFVRPLIREGLVRERTAHVTGGRQRMKVYDLTSAGRALAIRLRERVKSQVVRIREEGGVREETLDVALRGIGGRATLLEAVRQVEEAGVLDLERPASPSEAGLVEQLADAPHVTTFLGRHDDLAEITREGTRARVFVVRGIPGIGKSALAAKACDLVRGQRNLFWHRIRPWDSPVMVLADLGRFLDALDRPGLNSVLKRGEAGLAGEVLRQDLPDTRAFLVLDDAHEATNDTLAVVRMLAEATASAPDVKLLVLTRRALPIYDTRDVAIRGVVREIELDGLGPAESAALLTEGANSVSLVGLGRRLRGHPLLLELIRSHRLDIDGAIRDVHRFLEGTVYGELSDSERSMMKVASLYGVPVPRTTLLATPGSSYEALLGLQDRSLIRFVGRERYQLHDSIRDFFLTVLTTEERDRLGALAVDQLRELGRQASDNGDLVTAVGCLSNALQLAQAPTQRQILCESLGDASERLGDALAMSSAYREALAFSADSETRARLHRKLACAFERRGQIDAAADETAAGFEALGTTDSVELGWLELVRARTTWQTSDLKEAFGHAERARQILMRFKSRSGEAEALVELGRLALLTGSSVPDGTPAAEQYYRLALELAETLGDSILAAQIHLLWAIAIGYGGGDFDEGMQHYHAVESSLVAMTDPFTRGSFHAGRGWFTFRMRLDFQGAESDLVEARRIAQKTHDAGGEGIALYWMAILIGQQGRYPEAARMIEQAASDLARVGIVATAAEHYHGAVMYYLAAGDWAGYQRADAALHALPVSQGTGSHYLRWGMHQGLDAVVRGDVRGFESCFRGVFERLEKLPAHSQMRVTETWVCHFRYACLLKALGRGREAKEHLRLAEDLLRMANNRQGLALVQSDVSERFAQTLRERLRSSKTPSRAASRSASARGSPTPSTTRRGSGLPGRRVGSR